MISKVIFIGANRYAEDGPLLGFVDICLRKGIDVLVLTDFERIVYPTKSLGTFKQALENRDVNFFVLDRLDLDSIKQFESKGTCVVCVNCHWIVSPEVIDLFDGRIFNYHNSSLPAQRGAACHSWRIMQGESNSRLTMHELVPAVDEGGIVLEQELEFPSECRNLEQSYAFLAKFEEKFLVRSWRIMKVVLHKRRRIPFTGLGSTRKSMATLTGLGRLPKLNASARPSIVPSGVHQVF